MSKSPYFKVAPEVWRHENYFRKHIYGETFFPLPVIVAADGVNYTPPRMQPIALAIAELEPTPVILLCDSGWPPHPKLS